MTSEERTAIGELTALVGILLESSKPKEAKALGLVIFHRIEAILNGAPVHTISEEEINRALRQILQRHLRELLPKPN